MSVSLCTEKLLEGGSGDIDIFPIDVIWIHSLAKDFQPSNRDANDYFSMQIRNAIVDKKVLAVPWYIDVGLLYYRKDLLNKYGRRVPETWEELTETAKLIQNKERNDGNKDIWGFVWQGRAYEGLTCNALEWIPVTAAVRLLMTKVRLLLILITKKQFPQ